MSQRFTFSSPTPLVHGVGTASRVGHEAVRLRMTTALVITDPGIAKAGHVDPVTRALEQEGIAAHVFTDVQPDPEATHVEATYADVTTGIDGVVAVGGGSVIDTAKGMRLLAQFGGTLRDYSGVSNVPAPVKMPLIAISTTSGTGSQVSFGAVFSDSLLKTKFPVISPYMCPTLAINDASLTVSAPPSVTASAGLDALAHAVESFVARRANAMTRPYSLQAATMIGKALPMAMARGSDVEARDEMLLASTMAIIPASNAGLGLAHAVAMPLCALYHLPHGLVIGAVLGHVMGFNRECCTDAYSDLGHALGVTAQNGNLADAAVAWMKRRSIEFGLPSRLGDLGVRRSDIDFIVDRTLESVQSEANPRTPTRPDLIEWLTAIM